MARIIDSWTVEGTNGPTITHWHIGSGIETTETVIYDPAVSTAETPEQFLADYCAERGIVMA